MPTSSQTHSFEYQHFALLYRHGERRVDRPLCRKSSSKRCQRELYQIFFCRPRSLWTLQVRTPLTLHHMPNVCRPPANKPKPNTRFLRNIIKDTDSHNAALLAKEAAESRARLKSLSSNGLPREKPVGSSEIRRRQLGDIAAILGGKSMKRKRIERNQREGRRVNTSSEEEAEPEERRRGKRPMDEELEEKPRGKRPRDAERDREKEEVGRSRSDKSSQRRQRSASEQRGKDRDRRRRRSRSPREHRSKYKESRYRQRSPRRKCSRSPETSKYREKSHRHRHSSTDRKPASQDTEKPESKPGYDSDPLDDIIGPRPPPEVKRKGRGTISHASGIDSR